MNDTPIARLNAALSGRYRIERQLGEGGMATVYLADDLKHERKVALKVLKPELAAVVGAERFLTEIKTTAKLQHPHILPLFDSGQADSFLFYVMPYVEGESLRDRLDREHQLPVDEAVRIAQNVAEALDYAHRQGVIHRDIKPANILLLQGKPVLSDFGIALAVGAAGGGRLTETGLSLGTPHYMSPEQATGDVHVGPATDVYALGCVLYEMLVGEPPYTGSTPQAILGKIITEPPARVTKQRKSVPANVEAVIAKALEKVPADRFAGAADFAKALGDPGFRHGETAGPGGAEAAAAGPWRRMAAAMTTLFVLAASVAGWALLQPEPPAPVQRFQSPFREDQRPTGPFELLPDGSGIVYVGPLDTEAAPEGAAPTQLWIRKWDDLEATPMRGTQGVFPDIDETFAVSPDGREVAFVVDRALWVAETDGGSVRSLPDTTALGAAWSDDGWLYFLSTGGRTIRRVRPTGGPVETVAEVSEGEVSLGFPHPLPGGRALLVVVWRTPGIGADAAVWVVDLATTERKLLTPGMHARYVAGHLLYGTVDGALMAAPFDLERLELGRDAVTLAEGLRLARRFGSVTYSVSGDGSLAYLVGPTQTSLWQFVEVRRNGAISPVHPGERFNRARRDPSFRLSPDGSRVAFARDVDGNDDIWIKALPDGPPTRLTFDTVSTGVPTWSPDGESVVFRSGSVPFEGTEPLFHVWSKRADGSGEPELLFDEFNTAMSLWSPDRSWLIVRRGARNNPSGRDILGVRWGVDTVATPLLARDGIGEQGPAISPDGRWLAYESDETGRSEIFVRPFPNVGDGQWQVSDDGGIRPMWGHSGRELFFVNRRTRQMMAAEFTTTSTSFQRTRVSALFEIPTSVWVNSGNADFYGVFPGDDRFLMARDPVAAEGGASVVLVQNFTELLKRSGSD